MIKVSVIVPIYNVEKRLELCLKSLENQTLKEIEVILINDGSTDNSLKIINKHISKFPKLYKLIDRENRGISASRNEGIKISTGKYLSFVDSDDYIDSDMLEKLYNKIIENDSDIVVCNYKKVYENSKKITYHNVSKNCRIDSLDDNPKMIYRFDYAPWNKLYKRKLWDDVKYPIGLKYEDLEAILKVFLRANKIAYTEEYLYNYYQNTKGETATINDKVYDIFPILLNLKGSFENKTVKIWNAYRELCVSKIFIYNQLIIKNGDKELSNSFIDEGYKFIESNFKNWKLFYILKARNIKNLILRLIHLNKFVYKKYIDFVIKRR